MVKTKLPLKNVHITKCSVARPNCTYVFRDFATDNTTTIHQNRMEISACYIRFVYVDKCVPALIKRLLTSTYALNSNTCHCILADCERCAVVGCYKHIK